MKNVRPFSMRDKIGYTLGDLGSCCTEQFRAMFLAVFYTLVLKVDPVHVGILMLITKLWDAINDPIIGRSLTAGKTKGKGNSFRGSARLRFRLPCSACLALSM